MDEERRKYEVDRKAMDEERRKYDADRKAMDEKMEALSATDEKDIGQLQKELLNTNIGKSKKNMDTRK